MSPCFGVLPFCFKGTNWKETRMFMIATGLWECFSSYPEWMIYVDWSVRGWWCGCVCLVVWCELNDGLPLIPASLLWMTRMLWAVFLLLCPGKGTRWKSAFWPRCLLMKFPCYAAATQCLCMLSGEPQPIPEDAWACLQIHPWHFWRCTQESDVWGGPSFLSQT